jgi:ribosomal-protein-alanine N-acetyltransferase
VGVDFLISPLLKADIPAILAIEQHGQPEPWTSESFLEELDRLHSHLVVARLAKENAEDPDSLLYPSLGIVGYICFWCVADEIQVLNLAVHEDFRRQSIARGLLAHAIRTGCENGARVVNLEVRKSNVPALKLYESVGFKAVGERPNYYGAQREPAILMELELQPENGYALKWET